MDTLPNRQCPKFKFWVFGDLAIVNPIVNFKVLALHQIKSYKLNFLKCLFHIDTTQNKW